MIPALGNPLQRLAMRWLLLVATLLSWVLCFTRHGAGAMACWLLVGIVAAIATALAFAQARIEANAQPEIVPERFTRRTDRETPQQP
jgi:hypothetical protein